MATSRICGFIVYNQKHANVVKVLRDKDYWVEFDAISGANWPIFCVRPLDEKIRRIKGSSNGERMSMLVRSDDEPNTNRDILNYFGLRDSEEDLPCFVLFAWDDNDHLCKNIYRIDAETIDSTHSSLRQIILIISQTENEILAEYKSSISVYRNASYAIDALRTRQKVAKYYENANYLLNPIRKLIRFYRMIFTGC